MKDNGKALGLLSGLFWGLDSVLIGLVLVSKTLLVLGNNASLYTTFLHDTFSFILLFLLIIKMRKLSEFKYVLFSKSGLSIIGAALLGGPIGMSAYILSINYIGASLSSSISAVYPIIGMFFAYLFLKEKISLHNILGIMISIVAIILMSFSSTIEVSNFSLGLLLVLICALGWGSEAVIIKATLKEDVSSEVALLIRQMTTMLVYGFIIIPIIGYSNISIILFDKSLILITLISGVVGTISYLMYYKAIDLLNATSAMALNITYPAWAFIFQYLVDRSFNAYHFFLSLVIIVGAILSNENPKEFLTMFKKK